MIVEETYIMPGNNFNQRNAVHPENGVCRTIMGCGHAGNEPKVIVASRGRNPDNPSETGICRIETPYRIRKLTPLECWRLMDFTDEDFHKAEAVNSNTQLYKQAGNSIVKAVLMAIFKQMM